MSRRILPLLRSTHTACKSTFSRSTSGWSAVLAVNRRLASSGLAGVSWAVVSQICLPSMTGEDHPRPGMAVFQTTPSVSLHRMGGWALAAACPCPPGPRHSGHSGVADKAVTAPRAAIKMEILKRVFIRNAGRDRCWASLARSKKLPPQ